MSSTRREYCQPRHPNTVPRARRPHAPAVDLRLVAALTQRVGLHRVRRQEYLLEPSKVQRLQQIEDAVTEHLLAWWRLLANLHEDERRRSLGPKKKPGLFSGLFRRGGSGDAAPIIKEMANFAKRRSRKGNFGVDDDQLLPDTDKKDKSRTTLSESLVEARPGFVHRVESITLSEVQLRLRMPVTSVPSVCPLHPLHPLLRCN